jgi:hypothetical protein
MAKDKNIRKKADKKITNQGIKRKPTQKPTVKVLLPAVIPGRGAYDPEPPPCEHELSYQDAILAVKMEKLAAEGFNNEEIIDRIGVSRTTFYKRLKEDVYFAYALNKHRGKAVLDAQSALFQNVTGFEYEEEVATPAGKVVSVTKRKLPETKAIEFFLTNRDPENWKKKVETTHQAGETMSGMVFAIKRREE